MFIGIMHDDPIARLHLREVLVPHLHHGIFPWMDIHFAAQPIQEIRLVLRHRLVDDHDIAVDIFDQTLDTDNRLINSFSIRTYTCY
ncbi:hypothetical protein ES703_119867 [subsurface metagenome]